MDSLLAKAGPLVRDPFPHVVIHDALDYYDDLARTRPSAKRIIGNRAYEENQRLDLRSVDCLNAPDIHAIWKAFIALHTSDLFWREVREYLRVDEYYPGINWEPVGPRAPDVRLGMECQPGINTPLVTSGRVRGPHLDNTAELYGGMLYMRHADDDSTGGELQVCRWKNGMRRFHGKLECYDEDVEVVATVPYQANTFVLFLNTPDSVHAVTPRSPSTVPRMLVNVAADYCHPLFKVGHGRY